MPTIKEPESLWMGKDEKLRRGNKEGEKKKKGPQSVTFRLGDALAVLAGGETSLEEHYNGIREDSKNQSIG